MYPLSSEGLNKETDGEIYFFTPAFHIFDNFSAHAVEIWGHIFPTAEHAYQWKKFIAVDEKVADMIISARSPELVKKLSDSRKASAKQEWHEQKTAVMEKILRAKLTQHNDVREVLQRTGTKTIIENSPVDSFWGIGCEGKGENVVGVIWMKLRDELVSN